MSEPEAVSLTAEEIASLLEESNVLLIKKSIRVIGGTRVEAILEQALHIEATGGMLTHDQSRRRTPGGTFFALMRDAVSRQERYRLFGVPGTPQGTPVKPCTWDDVQEAINDLVDAQEATMKLTLIGRPSATQTKGQTVIFQLKGKAPGNLPKELPPMPKIPPLTWTVIVGMRQWNKVKASLDAHPDDRLVIDGYPTQQGDQLVLLATNCQSIMMGQAQKAAQRAKSEAQHS
jgi:hypothetical protein